MKDALAPLRNLPTIKFEDVSSESRRFLLLNMKVRKSLVSVQNLKEATKFISGMDAKALLCDYDQYEWLYKQIPRMNDVFHAVFYEIWLAVTELDCVALILKYPVIVQATIDPESGE